MDQKIEALHALGWNDELIEHFMVGKFPEIESVDNPFNSQVYETNTMIMKYDTSSNAPMMYALDSASVKTEKRKK